MNRQPDKPKIVFLGTAKIAAQILETLAGSKFKPQLVITGHDKKLGRGLASMPTKVKLVAQKYNIATSYELSTIDKRFDIAILVAYGKMIPDNVLRIPKFGFVNVHPSLLPKYRGPSPIICAILNGEITTGVTLIILDSKLDHGPTIAQKQIAIAASDTHDTLATKLANLGSQLLLNTLPDYLAQNITPQAQDHANATYTEKITRENGKINPINPPDPQTLERMVRAYYPWPSVWCTVKVNSDKSRQRRGSLGAAEVKEIRIKLLPSLPTKQPNYPITYPFLIQVEGKRPMSYIEFKNGYSKLYDQIKPIITNAAGTTIRS